MSPILGGKLVQMVLGAGYAVSTASKTFVLPYFGLIRDGNFGKFSQVGTEWTYRGRTYVQYASEVEDGFTITFRSSDITYVAEFEHIQNTVHHLTKLTKTDTSTGRVSAYIYENDSTIKHVTTSSGTVTTINGVLMRTINYEGASYGYINGTKCRLDDISTAFLSESGNRTEYYFHQTQGWVAS